MMRLETSLQEAARLEAPEIIAFLHYPPIFHGMVVQETVDLLKKYGVRRCYYGHVHGKNINFAFNGVYARFFTGDCPARSCVAVKTLPKGVLVEVEAIAEVL